MQVLNIGSINIDHAYRVDHVVRPGETISSCELRTTGGGKGANQTVALARAGVSGGLPRHPAEGVVLKRNK